MQTCKHVTHNIKSYIIIYRVFLSQNVCWFDVFMLNWSLGRNISDTVGPFFDSDGRVGEIHRIHRIIKEKDSLHTNDAHLRAAQKADWKIRRCTLYTCVWPIGHVKIYSVVQESDSKSNTVTHSVCSISITPSALPHLRHIKMDMKRNYLATLPPKALLKTLSEEYESAWRSEPNVQWARNQRWPIVPEGIKMYKGVRWDYSVWSAS